MRLCEGTIRAQGTSMSSLNRHHLFGVEGMVAVVVGGSRGIGLNMARILAENGASRVYIIDESAEAVEQASRWHSNLVPLAGDATSQETLLHLVDIVEREVGYINLLVTSMGAAGPSFETLPSRPSLAQFVQHAWKTPMSEFSAVYSSNCTAPYYTILAFLELLDRGNRRGNYIQSQVIATASNTMFMRTPKAGYAYCSSKAALVSLMKCFATFCVPWGIRFNTIAAGLFPYDTASLDKAETSHGSSALRPLAGPEDLAAVTLYLTSKAGTFVNGTVMFVDGRRLATAQGSANSSPDSYRARA